MAAIAKRIYQTPAFRRAVLSAASAYRRLLLTRALDISEAVRDRSALVLGPHPDDETLACGATIHRKTSAGTPVWVMTITDGRHSHESDVLSPDQLAEIRQQEALTACEILGLGAAAVEFLGFEDQSLSRHRQQLYERLVDAFDRLKPEEVYFPSAIDSNIDHRELNASARRAAADSGFAGSLYEYPVWFWDAKAWVDETASAPAMAWQLVSRPIHALASLKPVVVKSDGHIEAKCRAILAHQSQVSNITGENDWNQIEQDLLDLFFRGDELFFSATTT